MRQSLERQLCLSAAQSEEFRTAIMGASISAQGQQSAACSAVGSLSGG
jgi:hypothetical protein